MKRLLLPHLIGLAVMAGLAGAFATGDADNVWPDESDDAVVLGEEDLAERAEIVRNRYRRMTPGDGPLVQDVGTWPAAWEEFGADWERAPADRELGTWVVPMEVTKEGPDTVVLDGIGVELWRGTTDFAKDGTEDVTLTGCLVDEDEWPLYKAATEELASLQSILPRMRDGGAGGGETNGLRFTHATMETNGGARLSFAWEEDGNVEVFARAMNYTSWVETVVWTNDENEVVTNDFTHWCQVPGEAFRGRPDTWTLRDVVAVSNGVGEFVETALTNEEERVWFFVGQKERDGDGDGLSDGLESWTWHTDPDNPDTDGDGWADGEEALAGTNPRDRLDAPQLARGVLIHALKYSGEASNQWVQLHCSGPRPVDVSGFRLQAAGTNWETVLTLPEGTWMVPGHFLLILGAVVPSADLTADLELTGSYPEQPTAGVRLVAPDDMAAVPVDVVFYGTHVPFNEQGVDTNGWQSDTTNLWAAASRHLERWSLGLDTDSENDWRHVADGNLYNAASILDSDGDALPDEAEYNNGLDPLDPDMDGDGLLDGFEVDEGLSPTDSDTDGNGTPDGEELDPATGQTYVQMQGAQELSLDIAGPDNWEQGDDLGLDNSVDYTITDVHGFAVWGTVWEMGGVAEDYTVDVTGALTFELWEKATKNGHTTVNIFAVPEGTNALVVTVTDGGPNPHVTNSNEFGADICASFRAVALDVIAGNVGEAAEEYPGVFLLDKTVYPNAPRTMCRLSVSPPLPSMSPPLPGILSLEWESACVRVYPCEQGDGETPLSCVAESLNGFVATNLWLEGVAATNSILAWRWNGQTNGQDWATVTGVKLLLKEVSFSGPKYHSILKDDGTQAYTAPHWQDNSSPPDGDAEDTGDRKWPICFTRDSKMSASAKFQWIPRAPPWSILVQGDGPDYLDFWTMSATLTGNFAIIPDSECAHSFLDAIAYWPSFVIQWSFSVDGGATWFPAGTSDNPVYVTLGDPRATPYHTVIHLGCVNAVNETTEVGCIAKIWADFTDRDVRRIDNTPLLYWGVYALQNQSSPDVFTTDGLLKNADGSCGAWSRFFKDLLLNQGISSAVLGCIQPINMPDCESIGFCVKNWDYSSGSLTDLPGIPGQGNADPLSQFSDHAVVLIGGMIYDPSYGTVFPNLLSWEDASLDFFVYRTNTNAFLVMPNIFGVLQTALTLE